MRPIHSFRVNENLPNALATLRDVALNLRWSWDKETQNLFRWIEPDLWEQLDQNALRLLERCPRDRLEDLSGDPRFLEYLTKVKTDLDIYLRSDSWFQAKGVSPLKKVAYFSPEFGITHALPQYSGGLGVLAGDHLKSASSLGLPIVGVGLFYKQGYFRQGITPRGHQLERYPSLDPSTLALVPAVSEPIKVELGEEELDVMVWRARLGRVSLLLLDTDCEHNSPEHRSITDRLYGGDGEHRLRQEIILGMGGVRALFAVGEDPQVFHTNEGHAGFMGLERIRSYMLHEGLTFDEAVEATKSSTLFTTHTPVPAGIDRYSIPLIERYFSRWARDCDTSIERLASMGHTPTEDLDASFNMAVMGLHLSAAANGVARLHGEVSRSLFRGVWPALELEQIPITHVTNGVHPGTWVSGEMSELLSKSITPNWSNASKEEWSRVSNVPSKSLWQVRDLKREEMVTEIRKRLSLALTKSGWEDANLAWCETVLDPHVLTIGFARRFAPYKRADLLLTRFEKLMELCNDLERPVQFVFAGKAHPADDPGKEIVRRIFEVSFDSPAQSKFVFVPDYDMSLAKVLYQGCDIWLNTPVRPMEASGTSGMKAALNGSLNLSILDGWWAECYDGVNGWAIAAAPAEFSDEERERIECDSLYSLLENEVIPAFYERNSDGVPEALISRIKASLTSLGPFVTGQRMVREYTQRLYEPIAERHEQLVADKYSKLKELARWKTTVAQKWQDVHVVSVENVGAVNVDKEHSSDSITSYKIVVEVEVGEVDPQDVAVEVIWGPVTSDGTFRSNEHKRAKAVLGTDASSTLCRYEADLEADSPGTYGFVASVYPSSSDLSIPLELGLQILA